MIISRDIVVDESKVGYYHLESIKLVDNIFQFPINEALDNSSSSFQGAKSIETLDF